MRDQPLRAVALWQHVVDDTHGQPVLVVVAQTLRGPDQMARRLWLYAVGLQLLILALVTVLILVGLRRGLRPRLALPRAAAWPEDAGSDHAPKSPTQQPQPATAAR